MEKESNFRYIFCLCFVSVIFILFAFRLFDWQIVRGEYYRNKADSSSVYNLKSAAARGEILDLNGVKLAVNSTGFRAVFCKAYSSKSTENDTILKMINLFNKMGQEWIDEIPIQIDENGEYVFESGRDNDIKQLKKDYRLNTYATAKDCINMLASEKWYNCTFSDPKEKRDVLSVKYNMNKMGYNSEINYIFADDITKDMVAVISENSAKFPGVQIKTSTVRKYENGTFAPHIVGSIGSISQEEYNELKNSGKYELNSKIGKTGIEKYFEDYLIGTDGVEAVEISKDGTVLGETDIQPAQAGNTIYLTLDSKLQEAAAKSLSENVTEAQKYVGNQVTGSAVMINIKDFSVLCAQSCPSFDLNSYYSDSDYYEKVVTDASNPLYARVFEGAYTIGSTMKPAVALAALEEGVINSSTVYNCTHTYQRFAPNYMPVCMGTHGSLNLERALAVSCNIFFFEAANSLGITSLNAYQTRFGFGQKTGVEIYERSGIMAGPKERLAAGGTWYDGDTIAAAIGQSDNLVTPIQLATYAATIANNGVKMRTHLISKITDYSRQNVLLENNESNIEIMDKVEASESNWNTVKEAMRGVVTRTDGTAHNIFGNYGIGVAGKTGTAENTDNSADHETFICFAPYEDPQVAVAVMIEHGKTGTYPQYVVRDLLDAYFNTENGVKNEAEKQETAENTAQVNR